MAKQNKNSFRTYKVGNGDSWISIANKNKINLDDLLYWNGIDPNSTAALPMLRPGHEVYVQDPYTLMAASVSAEAPRNYVDFGEQGQKKIKAYQAALKDHKITWNQVPKIFQTALMQKGIYDKTDKAAGTIAKVGTNLAGFMLNPAAYLGGLATQKGLAYAADKISGRNQYGIEDVLDNTPIMGREYAAENPMKSTFVDMGAGLLGGWGIPTIVKNVGNLIRTSSQWAPGLFQRAAAGTGIPRQTLPVDYGVEIPGTRGGGAVFQSGTKGMGTVGAPKGSPSNGYRWANGPKGTFTHAASWNPGGTPPPGAGQVVIPPMVFPKPILSTPVTPVPFRYKEEDPQPYIIPQYHWYHRQSAFNPWQGELAPGAEVVPYRPGTGSFTISGEAPIMEVPIDQRLTQETLQAYPGYKPSVVVKVPGAIYGTPSNLYTTAGFENPAAIKIVTNK